MFKFIKTILHYGGIITYDPKTPAQKYFNKFLQFLPLASAGLFSVLSIMDLLMNVRTLPELADNCNLSITICLAYLKAIHVTLNVDLMKNILKEFEGMQLNEFHTRLSNVLFYTRIAMTQVTSSFILWNTVIVRNVLPFRIWLPFDMYADKSVYWITMIFFVIVFINLSFMIISVGSLITITMVFMCESVVNVQNKVRNIEWNLNENDHIDKLKGQLIECVICQHRLYGLATKVQRIVGVTETFQFLGVTLEVSLAALLILSDLKNGEYSGVVKYALYILTVLFLGSFTFYMSSLIIEMSSDISLTSYETNWYTWPNDMKRLHHFMIARTQKPIKFFIGGFIELSLKTYLNMLVNCYSIFTLIHERF